MKKLSFLLGFCLVQGVGYAAYAQEPPTSTQTPAASAEQPGESAPKPARKEEPKTPKTPKTGFSMLADASYAYRDLFGIHIHAGEGQISFGGMRRIAAFYGSIGVLIGATENGLNVAQVSLGSNIVFNVTDRFRLGVGPRFSVLRINRITEDTAVGSLGFGVAALAYYDIVKLEQHAVYLNLKANVDFFSTDTNIVGTYLGITPGVGFRF